MTFAMIFPGQGSHNFDLLKKISLYNSIIKKTFDEASYYINFNLWKLIQKKNLDIMNYNKYIQAIILTTSVSIYRLWKKKIKINPNIVAGHSLGEYSALVCAKCIHFCDGLKIVMIRNQLMKDAMIRKPGRMIAIIGLKINIIKNICYKFSKQEIVSIACINSELEVVISGNKKSVQLAGEECKKYGAKAIFKLSMHIASHCQLMKSAAIKLLDVIKKIIFHKPLFPIINNIAVKCETSGEKIKIALIKQLYQPVFWKQTIEYIISKKIPLILEIGISNVLTNLNKNLINILSISLSNQNNFLKAKKYLKKENY
ncbi:Malonyl CoA-acyl carrier protein transacylase [Buchnera aphidicola (Eriosoma grossulariae)]|uniref:ACP S-malonyltransferase n=1 Tax=Buchnera aphidicola TaxID=9 RepID=UPI003463FA6D